MGLGALIERNLVYEVTNTQSGATDTYTIITDGGPGMYADWGTGEYRGLTSIPPAWRALTLLAGLLGRVPWCAYRKVYGAPPVKLDEPVPLLDQPAAGFEPGLNTYRSWGLDRLGYGNGIGLIAARSPLGWPTSVAPVDASQVAVSRVTETNPIADFRSGEIVYYIAGRWYPSSEVVHFKGPCKPGALRGMGIVEVHFAAIDAARKLGSQVAAVSAAGVPTGVLKTLNPDLTKEAAQELKDAWLASQSTRTIAVLGAGVEFEPVAWNPTEVQLNEMRAFNITDWANIFGIDASFLGGQNPSRVYANLSEKGIDLLRFGNAGDLIAEFEATLTTHLPRGQYVKANLDFLLRADTTARYQAHAVGIAAGFLTPDEAREYEERPPLTQAQKDDLVALKAPAGGGAPSTAPAGQGATQRPGSGSALTAGQGGAAPRLAAVRELAEVMLDALIERGRRADEPRPPPTPTLPELELPDPAVDEVDPAEVATDEDVTDWPPDGAEHARARGSAQSLHTYWTSGPGLAKWASSRTPWRALRRHLAKYIKDKRKLDATTSAWYRDVFGRLPNG